MADQSFTTISLPKELADKIKTKLEGTSFHSVSSYATFILRQIVASKQEQKDEENTKEKLRVLGYI